MATHSSILAQRIPWTERLAGDSPWDLKESDMTEWLTLTFFSYLTQFTSCCSWINYIISESRLPEGIVFRRLLGGLSSLQFSCSVMSDSLWPHRLQHARLPCPSLTSRGCSKACPLSRWCHPTISSSVVPFSFYRQSLPASGSFPRVSPSHQVAKVSEFQFQHQSFQWIFRTDFL